VCISYSLIGTASQAFDSGIKKKSLQAKGMSDVTSVMAVKRLIPPFAFLIGYLYFEECTELLKKLVATALMAAGAILITIL